MKKWKIISETGFIESSKAPWRTTFLGVEVFALEDPTGSTPGSMAYIPVDKISGMHVKEEPDVEIHKPAIIVGAN